MQIPAVTPVTVLPLTVQMPVVAEVNVTGLPDFPPVQDNCSWAVPPTVKSTDIGGSTPPQEMLWLPLATLKFCVTCGAAL